MRPPRPRLHPISWPAFVAFWSVSLFWRYFVTGRSLTGARTDNATWFHAASKDYRDRPYETLTGPIWQRMVRRWVLVGVGLVLFLAAGTAWVARWAFHLFGATPAWPARVPWLTVAAWWELAVVLAAAIFYGRLAAGLWGSRTLRQDFVYPTWEAACAIQGMPYHKRDALRSVSLPEGFVPPDSTELEPTGWRAALAEWRERRALRREVVAIEAASGHAEGGADSTPEALPAVRLARFRGRRLDREPAVPTAELRMPPVRVALFPGKVATPAAKKQFLNAVTGPLGMPDALAEWYLRGRHPYVELRPNLLPPEVVDFERVRRAFEAATITTPVMGLAAGARAVSIDLDNNSPHTMISGGSGTGKSVLAKALLSQRMHHGVGQIMLDYKRVSHRWMHALQGDGVIYAWRLPHIHDVLVAAGDELKRRLETVLPGDNDPDVELAQFPVVDVTVEEINSTTMLLADYWRETGGQGQSPAISALKLLVNMGREYRMHVWIMAQRAGASVFGANGGDIRESFQTRLMAKWTVPTWKMLAGGAEYRRPIGGRGIWARVQDDEVEIVRTPFLTNAQAIDWARSGVACPPSSVLMPGDDRTVHVTSERTDRTSGPELVPLSAALHRLPGRPLGVEGIRTASKRPGFPEPVRQGSAGRAALYDLDALVVWKLERDGDAVELVAPGARPGFVYALDTLDPETGTVVVGYVGQTFRTLPEREREHRGDKPWADLIVGSIRPLWEGTPTETELDELERSYIRDLKPVYNVAEQKGAAWAIPLRAQIMARHRRDLDAGRPLWSPVDVYNGGGRPQGGYGEHVWTVAQTLARTSGRR